MKKNKSELLGQAKEYAFLLLKYRPRSEKEIYLRLKQKKFAPRVIQETVTFLKDRKFIDDYDFARAWIASRLKKPLGLRRIREELKVKGIDNQIVEQEIGEIKKEYLEAQVVREVAAKRLDKFGNIPPEKARNCLFAYLLRRGFSAETVIDVLSQICKQTD